MSRLIPSSLNDEMRLDAIREHLGIDSRFTEPDFTDEVCGACLRRARPHIKSASAKDGEAALAALARAHSVRFEEVRHPHDIDDIERRYLREKREIGFGQLRMEFADASVDALLFQRTRATETDDDRWVAILNLQESAARGYWSRAHELVHRIVEPPQQILPFRRHREEAKDPVESLIDSAAADIAFYPPLFRPFVETFAKDPLTFEVIEAIRSRYAPSASLLSVANATANHWPSAAMVVVCSNRGRKHRPQTDRALRVGVQARNEAAIESGLLIHNNMRPPVLSPLSASYHGGCEQTDVEDLGNWSTSRGKSLPSRRVLTSAMPIGDVVYGILSDLRF